MTQVRIPEFQSSPSRRLRNENNIENAFSQSDIPVLVQKKQNDEEKQRQIRLEKKRERSRSNRANESDEQRQIRLRKDRERKQSNRANDTEKERQIRLEKNKKRNRSNRTNETEEQREIRLAKNREQTRSGRTNETEEQYRIRLEKQKKLSQKNRNKKELEKQSQGNNDIEQENNGPRRSIYSHWPEPIPRDLKETRLQQFLQQMSMSELAETTCAVCNIRTPAKDSKKLQISKIPNNHLLKVSEELQNLIKNSIEDTGIFSTIDNTEMTAHVKSSI
jgi:hypothetical protein